MKPRPLSTARLSFPLAASLAAMLAGQAAQAANITWSGATNTWNTASNWVGGALPLSNDSLFFGAAGAGGLSLNNDLTSGAFTVASFIFESTAGAYVIGDGTPSANAGNTFVLGVPAAGSVFGNSFTNGSGNLQTINTPFSMTAGRSFVGAGDISLTGNISGAGGITKGGSNTLILSGTNTYTGQTAVSLGVLRLNSANAVPGGIGASGGLSNINLNGGVLGLAAGDFNRAYGTTTSTVQFGGNGGFAAYVADRVVNLGNASALVTWSTTFTNTNARTFLLSHPTATHTVNFQNPINLEATARTVQVDDGAAAVDAIISGNITGIASGNLTKTGNGTLVLSGANSDYIGTTTVSAGTLLINGTKSGTGTVTVNAGAALGGTGTINGAVTAAAGGRINLRDGAVGNLTLGSSLTLSGTAATPNQLFFDLGNGAGGTDKIITTGAHTAATSGGVLVHLNQLSGTAIADGTYTLIQGGAASNFTGYTLATTRSGRSLYSALGPNGNDLQVTVAAGTAGDAIAHHYWQGDTSVWNTAQWYSDAAGTITATAPGFSSNVRFGTTTAANLTNTLGENYEINSLTVDAGLAATSISGNMLTIDATSDNGNASGNGITANNADGTSIASRVGLANSQTWTVGTGAALTVSGVVSDFGNGHALTKAGVGTLTLSGVNTFSGPLTVSGGTLAIGGAGQLNSGIYGPNIVNNGTFSYGSSANQTLNGIISGTGSLNKTGGSTLTLNNSGTFSGGATISGGSLTIGGANLVNPLGSGTTTVNTGGTYALSATFITAPLTLNGGTVTAGNSFASNITTPVTLTAVSTLSVSGGLVINGNITGTGGLIKTSTAFVPINGSNNDYSGTTTIGVNGGGLTFKSSIYGNDTSKWIPDNITVNSGGALIMNVGGPGEFTMAQAGIMFSQLGGVVNNNGLRAGSTFGVDTRTSGGNFTISDNLIDSSGTGGGAISFRYVGNGVTGGSTLELTGNNTYSGQTIVDRQGTIKVSSINSVNGGSPPLASSSLGRPTTVATGTISLGTSTSFQGGSLTYTGTGETTDRVLNLGGGGGGTDLNRLDQSGTGLLKFTSNMTMTDTRGTKTIVLLGSTSGTGEMAGVIPNATSGSGTTVTKSGTGTWTLSGTNVYAGITTISGGTLAVTNLGNGGAASSIGQSSNVAANLLLGNGATLRYIGSGQSTDRGFTLSGTIAGIIGTLDSSGSGAVTFTSTSSPAYGTTNQTRTLNLAGSNTGNNTLAANIANNGTGAVSLTKNGAGTWLLTGTVTYSGATTVSQGILSLANVNTSNEASTVTIASTGATLNLDFAGTDTVDKLFIGSTQMPAGVYEALGNPGSGTEISQITGSGTLTVITDPPAGYSSWQTANGTAGTIDQDHDSDGVSNGVEYFLVGPGVSSTGFTALPGVVNTGGLLSVTYTKAGTYSGVYGTDFLVETSDTLVGAWTTALTNASPNVAGTVFISGNNVTYTFPTGTVKFARLRVTGP